MVRLWLGHLDSGPGYRVRDLARDIRYGPNDQTAVGDLLLRCLPLPIRQQDRQADFQVV